VTGGARRIALAPGVRARLLEAARRAGEREACGLLVGTRADGAARVLEAPELSNATGGDARTSFALDALEVARAERAARAVGLELLGAWHSHPGGDAAASQRDADEAQPGWWTLIVALPDEVRAWLPGGASLEECAALRVLRRDRA
jgi:proteasome lid subunit RPN8/RPN11